MKSSSLLAENWTWEGFHTLEKEWCLVIDAKPELKSWGGPLRQIKTYMDNLKPLYPGKLKGVFTTFSTISDRHRRILEDEGVYVVTFSKDGLVSGPVQSRLGVASK